MVELYQSQGCSSCPPAIANINAIAARPDVLALTFAVTYWDQLGWKDTFARPEFTRRQWDFAHGQGRGGVATPQTIINGRVITNGGDRGQLITAIRAADRGAAGPAIRASAGKVTVGGERATAGDDLARCATIRARSTCRSAPGRMAARTITHRNVVRSLTKLGEWTGGATTVAAPGGQPALRSAILVQSGTGGPIIAAARIRGERPLHQLRWSPSPFRGGGQAASSLREARLRSCGSRYRLRMRIALGVTSTSSSSWM